MEAWRAPTGTRSSVFCSGARIYETEPNPEIYSPDEL